MAGSNLQADMWLSEYLTPWDIYVHGITRVLHHQRTPYQDMHIVETGAYGKGLVLDGKWQSCTGDEFLYHETLVHPAMLACERPRRVLVLGGGEGATLREVLRWNAVEAVTMVDLDGDVVAACREHLPEMHAGAFDDPRVELRIANAIDVLAATEETWDVVISDLTDPIASGPSFPLFTREFFARVAAVLAPGGSFVLQAGSATPADTEMHARLVATLRAVFAHTASYLVNVPTFGAPWTFALSTRHPLELRPDPEVIDRRLAEATAGGLRALDGTALLGLQPPLYLRRAIAATSEIYTLAAPPEFFGTGVAPDSAPTNLS